jgi:hypothetical protein
MLGMVSDFAVAQCGQVMMDSRITVRRSALGGGGIAGVRRRLHERIYLRLAIVEGHNGRLIFEGHDDIADARHGLKTRFHGAGAKRASHMLNRERDGFVRGESKRRNRKADPERGQGKQFLHRGLSQGLSK